MSQEQEDKIIAMLDQAESMQQSAETTQQAVRDWLETAGKQTHETEKLVRTAQAAITELSTRLPAAAAANLNGAISKAVKEATSEAVADLNGTVRRMKTVATWWPTMIPVVMVVVLLVVFVLFTENRRKTLRELTAQIEERRQILDKTPLVKQYTDNGRTIYAVALKPNTRIWEQNGHWWGEMEGE